MPDWNVVELPNSRERFRRTNLGAVWLLIAVAIAVGACGDQSSDHESVSIVTDRPDLVRPGSAVPGADGGTQSVAASPTKETPSRAVDALTISVRVRSTEGEDLARDLLLAFHDSAGRLVSDTMGSHIDVPKDQANQDGTLSVCLPGYEVESVRFEGAPEGGVAVVLSESTVVATCKVTGAEATELEMRAQFALAGSEGREAVFWGITDPMVFQEVFGLAEGLRARVYVTHPGGDMVRPVFSMLRPGSTNLFVVERAEPVEFTLPEESVGAVCVSLYSPMILPRRPLPLSWTPQRVEGFNWWFLGHRPHGTPLSDGRGWKVNLPAVSMDFFVGTGTEFWHACREPDQRIVQLRGGARVATQFDLTAGGVEDPEGQVLVFPGHLDLAAVCRLARSLGADVWGAPLRLRKGKGTAGFPADLAHATVYSSELGLAHLSRVDSTKFRGGLSRHRLVLQPPEGLSGHLRVNLRPSDGISGSSRFGSTMHAYEGLVGGTRSLEIVGLPPGTYTAHLHLDLTRVEDGEPRRELRPLEWWQDLTISREMEATVVQLKTTN